MAASATTSIVGAGVLGAGHGLRRHAAAPPPAGRGSSGADDRPWSRRTGCGRSAAGTDRGEERAAADPKAVENVGQRASRSRSASGPELTPTARRPARPGDRAGRNDRGRTAAPHAILVGLVAPLHHRRTAMPAGDRAVVRRIERREGQRRRACEIARHQEAARRQGRWRVDVVAAGAQISGESVRRCRAPARPRGRVRSRPSDARASRPTSGARAGVSRDSARLSRDHCVVALVEQRQVEQPFAGIVDDVEREGASPSRPSLRALEFDRQPQFAKCAGSTAASAGPAR